MSATESGAYNELPVQSTAQGKTLQVKIRFKGVQRLARPDKDRRTTILVAAKRVFVRDGPAVFSARRVANEVGMSLGNLQYFFPRKDDLLGGMVEHVLREFEDDYAAFLRGSRLDPTEQLVIRLERHVQDLFNQDSRKLFLGLYSLACYDEFAESVIDQMYVQLRKILVAHIRAVRPSLPLTRSAEIATHITALMEGLQVFTGPANVRHLNIKAFSRSVIKSVLCLISDDTD